MQCIVSYFDEKPMFFYNPNPYRVNLKMSTEPRRWYYN